MSGASQGEGKVLGTGGKSSSLSCGFNLVSTGIVPVVFGLGPVAVAEGVLGALISAGFFMEEEVTGVVSGSFNMLFLRNKLLWTLRTSRMESNFLSNFVFIVDRFVSNVEFIDVTVVQRLSILDSNLLLDGIESSSEAKGSKWL